MNAPARNIIANYQNAKHAQHIIFAPREPNIVYVKNHKAACTTILGSIYLNMAHERGKKFRPSSHKNLHKSRHGLIPLLPYARRPGLLDRVLRESAFTFTYFREPISRVVSAYADKFMDSTPQRKNLLGSLGYEEDFSITLREFIHVLNAEPDLLDIDHHWRPQYREISYGDIDYHFIGLLENLNDELPHILRHIFPEREVEIYNSRRKLNHRTRSHKLVAKLHSEERKILEKLYAEDLDIYNRIKARPYKLP